MRTRLEDIQVDQEGGFVPYMHARRIIGVAILTCQDPLPQNAK
jgi:hypothetical protein